MGNILQVYASDIIGDSSFNYPGNGMCILSISSRYSQLVYLNDRLVIIINYFRTFGDIYTLYRYESVENSGKVEFRTFNLF